MCPSPTTAYRTTLARREAMGYRFFAARLRDVLRELFREDFRDGTFAPFSRASLSPMAMACLRLVTFRPEPLFSVPFFLRRIVDSTLLDADFPYFAICTSEPSPAKHVLMRARQWAEWTLPGREGRRQSMEPSAKGRGTG